MENPPAQPPRVARPHLAFLDGLRGLAALYVLVGHAFLQIPNAEVSHMPIIYRYLYPWVFDGHFAVDLFITISGFCLMLPVVFSGNTSTPGWTKRFLFRRARRILPPYYAALGFSLLLIALAPGLQKPSGVQWDVSVPAFTPTVIGSHLLLIHNLSKNWIWKINGPLWSIATEWDIYILFPLAILPLQRRLGTLPVLLGALLLTITPYSLMGTRHFERTSPWYVCLFIFGMIAAQIAFSARNSTVQLRNRLPWGVLTLIGLVGVPLMAVLLNHVSETLHYRLVPIADLYVGIVSAVLLIYCTQRAQRSQESMQGARLLFLQARPIVFLGTFSYSLYLIHYPLIALCHVPLRAMHLDAGMRLSGMLFLGGPLCVLLAYLFFLAVERPFLSQSAPPKGIVPAVAAPPMA